MTSTIEASCHNPSTSSSAAELNSYFRLPPVDTLHSQAGWIADTSALYCGHWFDLLGSGWVRVRRGMTCRGMRGHLCDPHPHGGHSTDPAWLGAYLDARHVARATSIWKNITPSYEPIDWQLDFKSGYRWDESMPARDIPIPQIPGVDIKVPWELSRMQHLPVLAYAMSLADEGHGGFHSPSRYYREFRDQILDFVATNPPGFGVNWRCTMDVSIRTANWVVAYDLLRPRLREQDPAFHNTFVASLYEHGTFVVDNLENRKPTVNNHYLSNLCGIVFLASYLESSETTDVWLGLAVTALVSETLRQFHPDGSNFEGSTSYHAQVAEMVGLTASLICSLPDTRIDACSLAQSRAPRRLRERFSHSLETEGFDVRDGLPAVFWQRLSGARHFLVQMERPDSLIPQIGDGDSGRFMKLTRDYASHSLPDIRQRYSHLGDYAEQLPVNRYWKEESRGIAPSLSVLDQILQIAGQAPLKSVHDAILTAMLPQITGDGIELASPFKTSSAAIAVDESVEGILVQLAQGYESSPAHLKICTTIPVAGLDVSEVDLFSFPDFGLYIYKNGGFYLALRCGFLGYGGHAHDDQLSMELWVDGEPVFEDPGSYVYTPLPDYRNMYRSAWVHAMPCIQGLEPAGVSQRVFGLDRDPRGCCLVSAASVFAGYYSVAGGRVFRSAELRSNRLIIRDWADFDPGTDTEDYQFVSPGPFRSIGISPGYGEQFSGQLNTAGWWRNRIGK